MTVELPHLESSTLYVLYRYVGNMHAPDLNYPTFFFFFKLTHLRLISACPMKDLSKLSIMNGLLEGCDDESDEEADQVDGTHDEGAIRTEGATMPNCTCCKGEIKGGGKERGKTTYLCPRTTKVFALHFPTFHPCVKENFFFFFCI